MGMLLKITTDTLMDITTKCAKKETTNEKTRKAFQDHMKKSGLFNEVKKGGKKYWFTIKKNYDKALEDLETKVQRSYNFWYDNLVREKAKARMDKLKNMKVPFNCSKLPVPSVPNSINKLNSNASMQLILINISNYCDKFMKVKPKNIVESIVCDVYINRLQNYCTRSEGELSSAISSRDETKANVARKAIVANLCYGNDLNIEVGPTQISTRLSLIMLELKKAGKIEDEDKQTAKIKNILNELTTTFPESRRHVKNFVSTRFVEFRRAAKVFCDYTNAKWGPAFSDLAKALKPLAEVTSEDVAAVTNEENINKINRQNDSKKTD